MLVVPNHLLVIGAYAIVHEPTDHAAVSLGVVWLIHNRVTFNP